MTQGATTKVMTAHVSSDLADQVDQLASRHDRSRAWAIKQALEAWVEAEQERTRLTNEGLASVAAGRVVEHADVVAWAKRLKTSKRLPLPQSKR